MVHYDRSGSKWNIDYDVALEEERRFQDSNSYERKLVSNLKDPKARLYFNLGLRRLFGYHHQEAIKYFDECRSLAPDCALAVGLMALCHCPNYNFTGQAYYSSTCPFNQTDETCEGKGGDGEGDGYIFPCQQAAHDLSTEAIKVIHRLNRDSCNIRAHGSKKRKGNRKKKVQMLREYLTARIC